MCSIEARLNTGRHDQQLGHAPRTCHKAHIREHGFRPIDTIVRFGRESCYASAAVCHAGVPGSQYRTCRSIIVYPGFIYHAHLDHQASIRIPANQEFETSGESKGVTGYMNRIVGIMNAFRQVQPPRSNIARIRSLIGCRRKRFM